MPYNFTLLLPKRLKVEGIFAIILYFLLFKATKQWCNRIRIEFILKLDLYIIIITMQKKKKKWKILKKSTHQRKQISKDLLWKPPRLKVAATQILLWKIYKKKTEYQHKMSGLTFFCLLFKEKEICRKKQHIHHKIG